MKLLEIKIDQDIFVVTGELDEGVSLITKDLNVFVNVTATRNGREEIQLGETFSGTNLDAYELLSTGIAAYFNDDTSVEFMYVSDIIKTIKESQSYTYREDDRQLPDYVIITSKGEKNMKLLEI